MFAGASSQILASSYREGKGREDLGFGFETTAIRLC